MQGFVYRWYDKSNGKLYVGSHKGTPDDGHIVGQFEGGLRMKLNVTEKELQEFINRINEIN